MECEFRLLGQVEIRAGGQSAGLGRTKEAAVLAVLALSPGRLIPAETLIDRVWGEDPPETRGALHKTMHALRDRLRRLGVAKSALGRGSSGYRLDVDQRAVDWYTFRQLVGQARTSVEQADDQGALRLLEAALDLWRGEALAGLKGEWADATRGSMAEEYHTAVLLRAETGLRRGMADELVGELQELLARFPFDEALARHLMLAHYQRGRLAEVVGLFRRFDARLRSELGAEPQPDTQELYRRILSNAPALSAERTTPARPRSERAPTPPANLPPDTLPRDLPDFVGREQEIGEITAAAELRAPDSAAPLVWAIDGMPGVGKSALALRAAHRLQEGSPQARLFVSLNASSPQNPARTSGEALFDLLSAFKTPAEEVPDATAARAAMWRRLTFGVRGLLVLDDADSTEQVKPLLPDGQGWSVLITSRSRLAGLRGARHLALEPPSTEEAGALFERLAGDRPEEAAEDVAAVVRICGGLPLAIDMMAAQLRRHPSWSLATLIARLKNSRNPVGEIRDGEGDLSAVFQQALHGLEQRQRRGFLWLGLHAGSEFAAHAAAALLGRSVAETERVLEALVEHNLLQERTPGRFLFHDLVGAFARYRLGREVAGPKRSRALGRLLDFYLGTADRADRRLHPHRRRLATDVHDQGDAVALHTSEAARQWLAAERENLLFAAGVAAEYGYVRFEGRIAHVLAEFLDLNGPWDTASRLHMRAVEVWDELGEQREYAQALLELSRSWRDRDLLGAAEAVARQAMSEWDSLADDRGHADALHEIGKIRYADSRYKDGLLHQQQALETYRDVGDAHGMADARANIAVCLAHLGDLRGALSELSAAAELYHRCGDRFHSAMVRNNSAGIYRDLGRHQEALENCWSALSEFQALGMRHHQVAALNNLGELFVSQDNYMEALECFAEAFRVSGDESSLSIRLVLTVNMAQVNLKLGRIDAAGELYGKGLKLIRCNPVYSGRAGVEILVGLGGVAAVQGAGVTARKCYQEALSVSRELELPAEEARALTALGRIEVRSGNTREGRAYWGNAIQIFAALQLPEADEVRILMREATPTTSG